MKAKIKLLIVVDTAIDYLSDVEKALEKQRQDYLTGTNGEVDIVWEIIRQDLSNLNWVEYGYGNDNYGLDIKWVKGDTANIADSYEDKIDSVAYVFDWNSWTTKGNQIWGWNLGIFYNGYQVQLVKAGRGAIQAMYYTFLMELMHAHNDFYRRATGKRLEDIFNDVALWDEDIVHARHDDYEVFKYIPVIRQMKDILIDLFKIKATNMKLTWEEIQQLYRIVFHREAGKSARGYIGYDLNYVIQEFKNSDEWFIYDKLLSAGKEIEKFGKSQ